MLYFVCRYIARSAVGSGAGELDHDETLKQTNRPFLKFTFVLIVVPVLNDIHEIKSLDSSISSQELHLIGSEITWWSRRLQQVFDLVQNTFGMYCLRIKNFVLTLYY